MTDIRITEADVGKRFRLRNGDVVTVTDLVSSENFPVIGLYGSTKECWEKKGYYYEGNGAGESNFDIVEKLPDEGGAKAFNGDPNKILPSQSISQAAMKPKGEWERPTPTMTASDGKHYPMELFGVQQRFSDRTPPEGVDLCVDVGAEEFMQRVKFQWREGQIYVYSGTPSERSLTYGEVDKVRWTLAPTPAVEKVEPQIWDPFTCQNERGRGDYFIMSDGNSGGLELYIDETELPKISNQIDALHAWKNHILSQHKGES